MSENQIKPGKLFYSPKVDVVFQDYKKALLDCIASVSDVVKISSSIENNVDDIQEKIALINLLNTQLVAVDKFVCDYCQIKEVI